MKRTKMRHLCSLIGRTYWHPAYQKKASERTILSGGRAQCVFERYGISTNMGWSVWDVWTKYMQQKTFEIPSEKKNLSEYSWRMCTRAKVIRCSSHHFFWECTTYTHSSFAFVPTGLAVQLGVNPFFTIVSLAYPNRESTTLCACAGVPSAHWNRKDRGLRIK